MSEISDLCYLRKPRLVTIQPISDYLKCYAKDIKSPNRCHKVRTDPKSAGQFEFDL